MSAEFDVSHTYFPESVDELIPLVHRTKVGRYTFLVALAEIAQALEDQVYDAYVGMHLPNARGQALDFWGWLAGVSRGGLEDDWYRALIEAAFVAKKCTGDTESIISLHRAAFRSQYTQLVVYEWNTIVLMSWREDWLPDYYAQRAAAIVRGAAPIGTVVLLESVLVFSSEARDFAPFPSSSPETAASAKVW